MAQKRYDSAVRREQILNAAIALASKPGGWTKLTRTTLAQAIGCSDAIVNVHVGDMPTVRRIVMKTAIQRGITEIILQSVVAHDGYAPKSAKLKTLLG
jgi:hypothetical protein